MKTRYFQGLGRMRGRQGAKNGELLSQAKFPCRSEIAPLPVASPKARLEYIASMVHELKIMSAQANCQVLAQLLERAHREAVQQRRATL